MREVTDYEIVTNATKQSIWFEKGLWDWKKSYIVFIAQPWILLHAYTMGGAFLLIPLFQ